MSVDRQREFVDTNILIYSLDATAGDKQAKARELLSRLWTTGSGCLSIQVLQEFANAAIGKLQSPLASDEVAERISDWSTWEVFSPVATDIVSAVRLRSEKSLSFWDAMIVVAAIELGCSTLWSEDLNNDQVIHGVRIRNPFVG